MLKVTRKGLTFIIPKYWIDGRGFLTVRAVHSLKLFFGEETLEEALKGAEKIRKYGWTIKEVDKK